MTLCLTSSVPLARRTCVATMIACVVTGCDGSRTGTADAAPAVPPARDTATLSAEAVAIAGFTFDTSKTVAWRSAVSAPARLMLEPSAVETIGSIVEGRITHVPVRVGDVVRAGDVLVMIHSHEIMDARNALSRAKAQVTSAEAERRVAVSAGERAHRLFDAKAMSRAEVERADAARTAAESMYEQAVSERDYAQALVEHLVGKGPAPPTPTITMC